MGRYFFILHKDKLLTNREGRYSTWVEAGPYKVVRIFDEDRVLVDLVNKYSPVNAHRKRELTLLKIEDGEIVEGDINYVK